eukprot:371624_1
MMSTKKVALNFDTIKNVDHTTRFIVFGFVRSVEVLFVNKIHIPSEIVLMCLLYYYNPEYFTVHGPKMILKDNGYTVESNMHSHVFTGNTAYGNVEINKDDYIKCIWDFEITNGASGGDSNHNTLAIGIAANKKNAEEMFVVEWQIFLDKDDENADDVLCGYNYGYQTYDTDCELLETEVTTDLFGGSMLSCANMKTYGCMWKVGDIVTMELDVQNEILKYYVNSIDKGIAVEGVYFDNNVKYVMAVACDGEATIKLINFKATYNV